MSQINKADKFIIKTKSNTNDIQNLIKTINKQQKRTKQSKEINTLKSKLYKRKPIKRIGIKTYKKQFENNLLKTRKKTVFKPTYRIKSKSKYKSKSKSQTNKTKKQDLINTYISKQSKYIIVIPSYNRPELIQQKTLSLLKKHTIKSSHIVIFVANREQYDLYKSKIPKTLYHKLVIGVKGLKNQRNYISNYYPEGTHIVQMDDDLEKIVQLNVENGKNGKNDKNSKKTIEPISNLDTFIKKAFLLCQTKNIFLWGVYPLANSHFMTNTITTDLRFIVGPMWGMINRHHPDLELTIDEKENTERTLQYWSMDGKVLRFNNIGIETKYYKNKGGMQNEGKNRKEEALKSVQYLHNKYPTITKLYLGKKSGVPELKLIRHKA